MQCYESCLKSCRQIESTEYVDDLFELKSRYGVPMLSQFAELVNREMFWVVTEVCSEHNLVRRSKIIKQFIKIAREWLTVRQISVLLSRTTRTRRFVVACRPVQGVQELQFHVRDRVRPRSRRGFQTESILGEAADQVSKIVQRPAGIDGSQPQHEQIPATGGV